MYFFNKTAAAVDTFSTPTCQCWCARHGAPYNHCNHLSSINSIKIGSHASPPTATPCSCARPTSPQLPCHMGSVIYKKTGKQAIEACPAIVPRLKEEVIPPRADICIRLTTLQSLGHPVHLLHISDSKSKLTSTSTSRSRSKSASRCGSWTGRSTVSNWPEHRERPTISIRSRAQSPQLTPSTAQWPMDTHAVPKNSVHASQVSTPLPSKRLPMPMPSHHAHAHAVSTLPIHTEPIQFKPLSSLRRHISRTGRSQGKTETCFACGSVRTSRRVRFIAVPKT